MDYVPVNKILHLHTNSVDVACQRVNLSKPGEIEQVVKILKDWIQEQPHFRRKDFSDAYIKMTILTSKDWDVRKDFGHTFEVSSLVILPKLTKDHHRVFLYKIWDHFKDASQISSNFKYSYIIAEYAKQCDFAFGYHIVIDFLKITNLLETINKLNALELKQSLTLYMEAYGMKILGIHILSTSKIIDIFVSILKQILKPKIVDRIHVYKTWDDLHGVLGKEIIPSEFGGDEKSIREIQEDWIEELSTKGFKDYLREMNTASTDETRRSSKTFSEEYAGMPGTFRLLSVD
ncbi:unnamed protein product [Colias eurytheme]|nr:unnamed protein product [Colias eurytheme]